MRILVKYASRSRSGRFFEGLESIYKLAACPDKLSVFCVLDKDDATLPDYLGGAFPKGDNHLSIGYSNSKIDAINRPIPDHIEWDILVNFSDDMRFTVYGWDDIIREGFRCNGRDKWLHYPDSTAKNMLCTMTIMDRTYAARDPFVYHPSFKSLWADNMAQDMAKMRGCYIFMGIQIFDHFHPAYGLATWDEQYERQQKFWEEDELNYQFYKAHNFFLNGNGEMENDPWFAEKAGGQ